MSGLRNVDVGFVLPDVGSWFNTMNDYATSATSGATSAANMLASHVVGVPTTDVHFNSIDAHTTMGSPLKPIVPSISMGTRFLPAPIGMVVPSLTLGVAPTFSQPDPTINFPVVPSPLNLMAPVKDFVIDLSTSFPTAPITTLPPVPTFISLNLPTAPSLFLPIFDIYFPTSTLTIPTINFSFFENPYSDALLTSVKNELLIRLQGGTGLNPVVEAAIWNRGRDREQRASLQAERSLLIDRSSSGFSRPPGAVMAALEQVVQETQSKIIDLSREIMIKQAELEQENIKTTIQQTIALEDILMREHNNLINRSFEVAKYIQELSMDIFKLEVSLYNTKVEAYKSFTVAYTAKVQAELAKIEIYKGQLEGQKLISDINEQSIRIYVAQIDAVKTNVSVYTAMVNAVSEKLKAEAVKVEVFKSEIEAYSEQVKSKAVEYSSYSEQVKAEGLKVDVFDSQVKAFTSRIQGYAASTDAKTKILGAEVSIEELKIKKYQTDIDAFIKQVQADQIVYSSAVDLYKGQAEMYLADVGLDKARAELALKDSENVITQNKYSADISIQNAQINVEAYKAAYLAQLEAKKAAGTIYSQLAASALSGINVSASVSGQSQVSASESHSYDNI
jgi:hypothetical protein